MAENLEKKVLIEVDANAPALDTIANLRKQVELLREAQKEQDTSTKDGAVVVSEYKDTNF
ncbi:hypothetical protein FACS189456_6080 [Bacteroidia bacterium]|nr:hypothetical protein FACS189456_6080 [Bacteroidia bacterium]